MPNIQTIQNLPYSEQVELAVLGGLMSASEAYDEVADIIKADSFYLKKNQIVFQAIEDLAKLNYSHDVIGVYERIKTTDQENKKKKYRPPSLEKKVGGMAYLFEIVQEFDSYSNIRSHAKILVHYRTLRKLIETGNKINELGTSPAEQNTEQLINDAERLVFEIGKNNFETDSIKQSEGLTKQVRDRYNKASKIEGLPGLDTGFSKLNETLLGLQEGSLYILAARPGVGKTSFALNIANNIAKTNKAVLIFSLEMTGEELMRRIIAGEGEINATKIMLGSLDNTEFAKFSKALSVLQKLPIETDESSVLDPIKLAARARRIYKKRKEHGAPLGLIIIDYIQLMNVPWIKDNRVREISEITRHLKTLAKDLQIPILALSQLNREIDKYNNRAGGGKMRQPRLSDLRDSGSIEQDADVIMFIERILRKDVEENKQTNYKAMNNKIGDPGMAGLGRLTDEEKSGGGNEASDPSQAFLYIAKNRHGTTAKMEFYFAENYTKFMNNRPNESYSSAEYAMAQIDESLDL